MNFKIDSLENSFYPGSIWVKRIARLMVIMAIGANLFMNDLQDHIITLINEQSCEIALITDQIDAEKLRLNRIEDGSWKQWSVDWLAYFMESPKSNEINTFIDFSHETLDGYEAVSERLLSIDSGTALAMRVLYWTSLLMWIPIVLSLIWLMIDMKKGKAPLFVFVTLIISIPVNVLIYEALMLNVAEILGVVQ